MSAAQQTADSVRRAFSDLDLQALGALLTDDVRWGDDHPRRCRGRAEVLAFFEAGRALGATAEVVSCHGVDGPDGSAVVCRLRIRWPARTVEGPSAGGRGPVQRPSTLFHVYRLRDGLIAEIVPATSQRDATRTAAELTGTTT